MALALPPLGAIFLAPASPRFTRQPLAGESQPTVVQAQRDREGTQEDWGSGGTGSDVATGRIWNMGRDTPRAMVPERTSLSRPMVKSGIAAGLLTRGGIERHR